MPRSGNELFHDALLRHQIYLMRSAQTLRRSIQDILSESERDIKLALYDRPLRTQANLRSLVGTVERLRRAAWKKADLTWLRTLADLTAREPEFLTEALAASGPLVNALTRMSKKDTHAIATTQTVMGKTSPEWLESTMESDVDRISTAIRFNQERNNSRKVLVSNYGLQVTRTNRDLETVLLTLLLGLAAASRREFFARNNVVEFWRFVAVLDNRTTELCRSLSNKRFPMGQGPWPPLHWRCRSTGVPIIRGFGPEPKGVGYNAWLSDQPIAFLIFLLGKRRADQLKAGTLKLTTFTDFNAYQPYTLEELQARESEDLSGFN